ncbi:MAG: cell wall-binding repeat-containing protein [Coriobacteriales bacterium]
MAMLLVLGINVSALAEGDSPTYVMEGTADPADLESEGISTMDVSTEAVDPDYSWYNTTDTEFTITNAAQFWGFEEIVNGTADGVAQDDFSGKTVYLGGNIMLGTSSSGTVTQNSFTPIGTEDSPFAGTFDGNGSSIYTVRGFKMELESTSNVGLFGYVSSTGAIQNVSVNSASVSITVPESTETDPTAISPDSVIVVENIGILVGYDGGSLSNCSTTNCTLDVVSGQTACGTSDNEGKIAVIRNVGGIAGTVDGDVTGCDNATSLTIKATGTPCPSTLNQVNSIAENIGGVVGKHGGEITDSSGNYNTSHGNISDCTNSGTIQVSTTGVYYNTRWQENDPALAANVGGIAGYSIGNIDNCSNTAILGYPYENTPEDGVSCSTAYCEALGGIVGSLRSSNQAGDTIEVIDPGMTDGADDIAITNCSNTGDIYGWNCMGGIGGFFGTNLTVSKCWNSGDVSSFRWNKPCPGGIVSMCYGDVSYCYNTGQIATKSDATTYASGYYAAGIVGMSTYYSGPDNLTSDAPVVKCCYNAGIIRASGDYRQGAIVGANDGTVMFCAYLENCVPNASGRDVVTGGNTENDGDEISNYEYDASSLMTGDVPDSDIPSAIALLNSLAYDEGWETYFVPSSDTSEHPYPVLNDDENYAPTGDNDLSSATVEFSSNAVYSSTHAPVPQLTVVVDGETLVQDRDYKVIVDSDATVVGENYSAQVEGIGNYSGTSTDTATYSIDKADLGDEVHSCSIVVDSVYFNWEKQDDPSALNVTVLDESGNEVPSDQYEVSLPDTSENAYKVAGSYNITVTAKDDSTNYTGSLTQNTYTIKKVPLYGGLGSENDPRAQLKTVTLGDDVRNWIDTDSDGNRIAGYLDSSEFTFTGDEIKPECGELVYLDQQLTEDVDYRNLYGNINPDDNEDSYSADYVNVTDDGEFLVLTIKAAGGSSFSNWYVIAYTIEPADISTCEITAKDMPYTGEAMTNAVTVTLNGNVLTEGVDYEVTYSNNVNVGTATYTVSPLSKDDGGSGNLEGDPITGTFNITEGSGMVNRIGGKTRYDTAANEALEAYSSGSDSVIVASGENYPDALSATSLAGALDCPILLTQKSTLPDATAEAISMLDPDTIIVVGGAGAVSDDVYTELSSMASECTRLYGKTRTGTAIQIYEYGLTAGTGGMSVWGDHVIVASGSGFADALSVAPLAFAEKYPIFLSTTVGGIDAMLDTDTRTAIGQSTAEGAIIVGGKGAVSSSAANICVNKFGEDNVERLGGTDRYETSKLIGEYAVTNNMLTWDGTAFASGTKFPDALAGSVLQGKTKSVMLLVKDQNSSTLDELSTNRSKISEIRIFGGTGAVSNAVINKATSNLNWNTYAVSSIS